MALGSLNTGGNELIFVVVVVSGGGVLRDIWEIGSQRSAASWRE